MTNHHTASEVPRDQAPTTKQQAYIRQLALARGISFTPPRTKREASQLIDSLRRRRPDSPTDRLRETRAVQADMATRRGDSARVREHELDGHGSSATWKERA
jgi:hypothetical protein